MHPRVQELIARTYADQRSNEWLALRGTMLTASDLATAIGINPYEKPSDLLLKKCGALRNFGNAATAHGTLLEPVARDLYDARYDQKSHEIGLVQHPRYPWLGGSPDGVTESGRLIEIKCPLTRKITPQVPKYYIPQIQLLLEILDLEVCDFIQYRPGPPEEFQVTEVVRDREWFQHILPIAQAFWTMVLDRRANGICEVVPDDENQPEECVCEIVTDDDDEVSTVSETGGNPAFDMSSMQTPVLSEVHSTGSPCVSEHSVEQPRRTYTTRAKARQSRSPENH
jgi:putative phage-type endonuclease